MVVCVCHRARGCTQPWSAVLHLSMTSVRYTFSPHVACYDIPFSCVTLIQCPHRKTSSVLMPRTQLMRNGQDTHACRTIVASMICYWYPKSYRCWVVGLLWAPDVVHQCCFRGWLAAQHHLANIGVPFALHLPMFIDLIDKHRFLLLANTHRNIPLPSQRYTSDVFDTIRKPRTPHNSSSSSISNITLKHKYISSSQRRILRQRQRWQRTQCTNSQQQQPTDIDSWANAKRGLWQRIVDL